MLKKVCVFVCVGIFLASSLAIPPLEASLPGEAMPANTLAGEEIVRLIVGETRIFSTRNPTRVLVGNPQVADIATVTAKEITVSAKAPGTTTLVYWDSFGENSLKLKVASEDILEIKRRVDHMLEKLSLPSVYTQAEEEEGKVVLLGVVKNAQDRERIGIALGPLKDKTLDLVQVREEEAVIEIDVQVLELSKDASKVLGFTWPGSVAIATDAKADGNTWVLDPEAAGPLSRFSTFFQIKHWSRTNFYWRLDALVQEGKARILSRPRLACQSGKEADLMVGGEKPVFTTSMSAEGGTSTTKVEYKEFGIKLKIKPELTEAERMRLSVKVEVSEVGEAETISSVSGSITTTTGRAYPITKRNASTIVFINDGQTMAIGGLMRQKSSEDLNKFPWLADLPVLGAFFRKRTTTEGGGSGERGNTELYITLTPTIVSTTETSRKGPPPPKEVPLVFPAKEIPPYLETYVKAVRTKINNAIFYPQQARDAGWEGDLMMSLNIGVNGDLKGIKIVKSSGYQMLDDAAQEIANKQAPYPPFPPNIESQELWVDVPIVYKKN